MAKLIVPRLLGAMRLSLKIAERVQSASLTAQETPHEDVCTKLATITAGGLEGRRGLLGLHRALVTHASCSTCTTNRDEKSAGSRFQKTMGIFAPQYARTNTDQRPTFLPNGKSSAYRPWSDFLHARSVGPFSCFGERDGKTRGAERERARERGEGQNRRKKKRVVRRPTCCLTLVPGRHEETTRMSAMPMPCHRLAFADSTGATGVQIRRALMMTRAALFSIPILGWHSAL